jgi:hypothetical protein
MRIVPLGLALLLGWTCPAFAVNTWAGNTPEDMAEEQEACGADAARFCGPVATIFIFEMENCLKRHMPQLSKACRQELSPTDFRKYHDSNFDLF